MNNNILSRILELLTTLLAFVVGKPPRTVGVEVIATASGPYAAKDVIADPSATPTANLLTFTGLGEANRGGYIAKVRVMTDLKTCTARVRLHLFHTAPTPTADNSPYLLLYTNANKRIGQIDMPAFATEDASNSTAAASLNDYVRLMFALPGDGGGTIYGILETLDAFTPAAGQKIYVELTAVNA